MNASELLRIVDAIHRDKNIEKEIVFEGIEQAILSAARKHFGEDSDLVVSIDRESGEPSVLVENEPLLPNEIGDLLGRIAAQTAKQVMIQKIREAERDALHLEFTELRGQIVTGSVSRLDGGSATVNLGKVEGILPRGEQIPGESHRVGERVRAVVIEVRKVGSRVRIILSRTHPELVRRLFELEIPEVADHVIEVRSLAREAGYRSKVAVSCIDSKIDCVGACVGVRGSRIKSVVDELAGERIDIVRWNDSLQVLVPNALQPAEVEDVILCPMLGKVIILVRDDQLSLAIGKKGQNVRLASKLVGWDIHIMTQEKLDVQLEVSVEAFSKVPEVSDDLAENLVSQGFFSFDDLSVIEPDQLAELGGLTTEQCDVIVAYADVESARVEEEERIAYAEKMRLRRLGIDPRAEVAAENKSEGETAEGAEEGVSEEEGAKEEAASEVTSEEAAAEASATEPAKTDEEEPAEGAETSESTPESGAPDESASEISEATASEPIDQAGEEEATAVADEAVANETEAEAETGSLDTEASSAEAEDNSNASPLADAGAESAVEELSTEESEQGETGEPLKKAEASAGDE